MSFYKIINGAIPTGDQWMANVLESLSLGGLNLIRVLQDRSVDFSGGTDDWFGEAYVDSNGRENSVDTSLTTATFDTDKYKYVDSSHNEIYHTIPSGRLSSTVSSSYAKVMYDDWEDGASVQYKLFNYDELIDGNNIDKIKSELTTSKSLTDIPSATNNDLSIFFKSDGTKMYVSSWTGKKIYQYSLSTAWDITTASYDSKTLSTPYYSRAIYISSDGTKIFFLTDDTSGGVYEAALSTAWDISTGGSFTNKISYADNKYGIWFKPDGTILYLTNSNNDIFQYSLSTAWDLSTAGTPTTTTLDDDGGDSPHGISFSNDGTVLFVIDYGTDSIVQHTLSTAWDSSTASYDTIYNAGYDVDVFCSPDGTKLYVTDGGDRTVREYQMGDYNIVEETDWLNEGEVVTFTAFTSEPTQLIVKLVPKTSSPTAGYPSIKGVAVRGG